MYSAFHKQSPLRTVVLGRRNNRTISEKTWQEPQKYSSTDDKLLYEEYYLLNLTPWPLYFEFAEEHITETIHRLRLKHVFKV